jgi:hypothetical protein
MWLLHSIKSLDKRQKKRGGMKARPEADPIKPLGVN